MSRCQFTDCPRAATVTESVSVDGATERVRMCTRHHHTYLAQVAANAAAPAPLVQFTRT
jgi:hypothetical protein